MRKLILLAALLLFMPAFAETHTIDASILGNSTSYDAYPGDIYVLYWNAKTITITSHAGQLDINELLPPGGSYSDAGLNFTVSCSYCPNQTINMTCPECGDCFCRYESNITSDAEILAYRYKYESCNDSLIKCYENQARCDNRTMGYMTQIDNANNMASVKFEEGKRTQAQLDSSNGIFVTGLVLFLLVLIVAIVLVSMRFGWIKWGKATYEVNLHDPDKPRIRKMRHDAVVGSTGKGHWQVGDNIHPEEHILGHFKDDEQQVVVIASPELQSERFGKRTAELSEQNKVLQGELIKTKDELEDIKERTVDDTLPPKMPKPKK